MAKSRKSTKRTNKLPGYAAIVAAFLIAFGAATWAFVDSKTPKYDAEAEFNALVDDLKLVEQSPSEDLAAFLKSDVEDKSGCPAETPGKTHFRGELGDFALINYGCGETDGSMYVTKKDGAWKTISPTNNFYGNIPYCTMVGENDIPKALYPSGCFKPSTNANSPVAGTIVVSPEY